MPTILRDLVQLSIGLLLVIGTVSCSREDGETNATEEDQRKSAHSSVGKADAQRTVESLRGLLQKGSSRQPSFLALETEVRVLGDEELFALIEELRPLGVNGYHGWLRCALFAEWGRRDPEGALAYLLEPPPLEKPLQFQNRGWEERQAFYSVFRGWAEVDPDAALARMKSGVNKSSLWHEYAYREIFRGLAARDGVEAWNRVPVEGERGGALQGYFRGFDSPIERLAAVKQWYPERISPGGLGYRIGPETFESMQGVSRNIHASSLFYCDAALALAELDLESAVRWVKAGKPSSDAERFVRPLLLKWAEAHPQQALAELKRGHYDTATLVEGILRGDPTHAALLSHVEDEQERRVVLERVIELANGERVEHFFPSPDRPPHRQQDAERFRLLNNVVDESALDQEVTDRFRSELRREFSIYLRNIPAPDH